MKHLRPDRWAHQLQPPRNPRLPFQQQRCLLSQKPRASPQTELHQRQRQVQVQWRSQTRYIASRRKASSAAAVQVENAAQGIPPPLPAVEPDVADARAKQQKRRGRPPAVPLLNSPSHRQAAKSAKLSALHARLSLPSKLPLQTLARCLIDPSVDPRPGYNNAPLALLGQDLLGYYTSEYLICSYPRLPMPVLFAAQHSYAGSPTLAAMRVEWGVDVVAAPGPEVDPGLLQLKKLPHPDAMSEDGVTLNKDLPPVKKFGTGRPNEWRHYRRGFSSRIVYDDQFGDLLSGMPTPDEPSLYPDSASPVAAVESDTWPSEQGTDEAVQTLLSPPQPAAATPWAETEPTSVDAASASFVRALVGALHLHAGAAASQAFHRAHILSRHLELHKLFAFKYPTRDLSFLCNREGFEPPVARLISETGRLSRSPVYVVGVFSGDDKLGEAAGSSLNEGRVRAAAAALRAWYLYSPPEADIMFPSTMEGPQATGKKWKPQLVDMGEVTT